MSSAEEEEEGRLFEVYVDDKEEEREPEEKWYSRSNVRRRINRRESETKRAEVEVRSSRMNRAEIYDWLERKKMQIFALTTFATVAIVAMSIGKVVSSLPTFDASVPRAVGFRTCVYPNTTTQVSHWFERGDAICDANDCTTTKDVTKALKSARIPTCSFMGSTRFAKAPIPCAFRDYDGEVKYFPRISNAAGNLYESSALWIAPGERDDRINFEWKQRVNASWTDAKGFSKDRVLYDLNAKRWTLFVYLFDKRTV